MTNLDAEPTPFSPPTPAPAPTYEHRWARSNDRIVLGVAGGLGRALAIDPLIVRIAFVVLALFGGVGILLYIAGLALLADSPTSPPPSTIRRIAGAVALFLSARWLFTGDARLPGAGWVVAIGLLGAAIALWRGRAPVELPPAPVANDMQPGGDGSSTSDRWNSLTTRRRERPRPPRSPLGLLTIGAATVVGALVWLLAGSADHRGAWAFGWATVVLGAGLLVGTFAGRARWLIVPALATATAAVAASALSFAGVGLDHRSGDRTEFVGAGSAVAPEYRAGFGNLDLILIDHQGNVVTSVDVAVGNLTVDVPDNAEVQIDAAVGVGRIDALGSTRNGYRRTLSLDSNPHGAPLIKLRLRVGIGNLEVRRGSFVKGPLLITPTTLGGDVPALKHFADGTVLFQDGSIDFGDGRRIEADGSFQIPIVAQNPDGSVELENNAVIRADGTVVSPGGFVIPPGGVATPPRTIPVKPTGPTTTSPTTTSGVKP